MTNQEIIITAAVTGSFGDKSNNPQMAVTPEEIAGQAIKAHMAGAAVAHIHVRNPETGEPSMELSLYREVVERIRHACDMIINLTTGAGARIVPDDGEMVGLAKGTTWSSPEKRTEHIAALKPELCSLDVGSVNFGTRVFANIMPHVEQMAKIILEAGVKPELEVFEMGHIEIAKYLIEKKLIKGRPMFQLCMGIPWGISGDLKNLLMMKEALPPGSLWGGFGIAKNSFPMATHTALLGGNIRVGFEDNYYLAPGKPAKDNAALVTKAVSILGLLGLKPAGSDRARQILGLTD
ncbi:MAG: 3-keto-5-aminohexanoate cleavage protein [Desulfobacteraceae bacterium]|nr:3-keto-5-aminohexanoate cleavage protein [Desulfobacteraceae bacterium]